MIYNKRVPIFYNPANRSSSTSKDQRMVNCYFEAVEDNEYYAVKRPGTTSDRTVAVAVGRGLYMWRDIPYSVFGTGLYNNTSSIKTLSTSTGIVSFSDIDTGTKYLLVHDGAKAYQVETDDTVTEIVDAQYPGAVVKGLVVVDGYMFVMDSSGIIYNSEVDTPLSWLADGLISAEIDSDDGVALAKHLNYVVALGKWTTEIFYNASNSTGSPLNRIPSAVIRVGCAAADTVAEGDGILMWVGKGRDTGVTVQMMTDISPVKVSTKPVEKILESEGSNISNADAYYVKKQGHYFYVLTLPTTAKITLAYDIVDGQWCEWTSDDGATESNFAYISATDITGTTLLQHRTDGDLYSISPSVYQDGGNDINVKIVTREIDFGTNRTKFHDILEIIGDRIASTSAVAIRYSDDDYQTWSTARNVDMNERATLSALGSFERRAFEITHTANTELRISSLEFTGSLGQVVGLAS